MKQYYYKKDGVKIDVDFDELIDFAKENGYEDDIETTSKASNYLRLLGYEVGENL